MADGEVRAEDLTQETAGTLSGDEQFVMFDAVEGKRADIDVISEYMVGDKSTLDTTDKSSIVGAINEVCGDLQNGTFEGLTAGNALQLLGSTYTTDKTPYLYRKSGGGVAVGTREFDTLVGATVAWNQFNNNSATSQTLNGVTFTKNDDGTWNISGTATANTAKAFSSTTTPMITGHKYVLYGCPSGGSGSTYCFSISGVAPDYGNGRIYAYTGMGANYTARFEVKNGATVDLKNVICMVSDLTAMFGTAIADYIYNLESGTAGAGVAWIKDNYPELLKYHAYDAGSLISTKTSAHVMRDADDNIIATYTLPNTELRGLFKLDNGKLYADGDVQRSDGGVTRKYAERAYQAGDESLADAITDGTNTVYKLITPTTETGTGFTNPQIVDPDGTEEYIDERAVAVPVGHETDYPTDLVKKIESIPNPPTANGTYVLKATVTGGVATISWEAQ